MLLLVFVTSLAVCGAEAQAHLKTAATRAEAFDLEGALTAARLAENCDEAAGAVEYLEGLIGAQEAAKVGGTVDSLREVRSAANALSRRAEAQGVRWEIASLLMRAAAAASQYERDEMGVFLAEATRREQLLLEARQPPVPLISAHELAADLWLQVHRFDEARRAYGIAADHVGRTGRVLLGEARSAARLQDTAAACNAYRDFVEWWGDRSSARAELVEARTYVLDSCPP